MNTIDVLPPREQFVQEWVDALRSGEYRQTRSVLRDAAGYCCLGVACDLATTHGYGKWHGNYFGSYGSDLHAATLPIDFARYLGITSIGDRPEYPAPLGDLNDQGISFVEIADIIEAGEQE